MSTTEPMHIISLVAENVKRLKAVRIDANGKSVILEGRNAQGKSSVIDAISGTLGGASAFNPDMPIRKGSSKASTRIDLGDLIVERTWTKGGSRLSVEGKDGTKYASPQAVMDRLFGDLTFDPLAFERMSPEQQAKILRRAAGIDTEALDEKYARIYEKRRVCNRELAAMQAAVPVPPFGEKPERVDIAALYEQKKTLDASYRKRIADESKRQALRDERESLKKALSECESALAIIEAELDGTPGFDPAAIDAQIDAARATNALAEKHEQGAKNRAALDAKESESEGMTKVLEAIKEEKRLALESAKWPLEGLSIADGIPQLNGIPLSQASSSERLRVAMAIGLAQNAPLRIMLCRDGARLDAESMNRLMEVARTFDAQIWIEKVADTKSPASVWIEDGEVV